MKVAATSISELSPLSFLMCEQAKRVSWVDYLLLWIDADQLNVLFSSFGNFFNSALAALAMMSRFNFSLFLLKIVSKDILWHGMFYQIRM
ncbi:hypothetical protein [Aliivibrio fischeri]|uniref:hypothetical protein n=1 Tax=Aliivibrio fischeri TaxID=668 RepID=UPI0007C4869D|nr:hypothetical protein [Aliivibrio fischeri]